MYLRSPMFRFATLFRFGCIRGEIRATLYSG
ncbi:MAG: hypothetical protein ACI9RO_001737 [Alteromonas macleodii]|jgi:hypothetical protein